MYKTMAGIASDPSAPGFRRIIMAPVPDRRIGHVKASYKSPAGLIRSAWRYEGDEWVWDFTVPEGATASVTLPGRRKSEDYLPGSYTTRLSMPAD
jgi:alpha-L-rhamnosidase